MAETYNEKESKKPKDKKIIKFLIIATVLLAVVGVSGYFVYVAYQNNQKNPVVAEVSGEKVYLKDYQKRFQEATFGFSAKQVSDAKSYAKDSILHDLVENKILDSELAKRNLKVQDSDITVATKVKFPNYDKQDSSRQANDRALADVQAKENVLKAQVSTYKEGYILYCRFDRADQDDYAGKAQEAAALRTKDQAYAKDYCDKMKGRLKSGQSSPQAEIQGLMKDPVIGKTPWRPYSVPFGASFDKNHFASDLFPAFTDIFQQISQTTPKSDNSYYLLTIKNTGQFGTKGQEDMYAVLNLKNGHTGETTDFQKWLQNKWSEYQIKTYPERIK